MTSKVIIMENQSGAEASDETSKKGCYLGGVLTAEWELSRDKRCGWVEMCAEGFPSREESFWMRKWETLKELQNLLWCRWEERDGEI